MPLTEAQKAYQREYHRKNREKRIQYHKDWYAANRSTERDKQSRYRSEKKSELNKRRRDKYREDPASARAYSRYYYNTRRKLMITEEQRLYRKHYNAKWRANNIDKVRVSKVLCENKRRAIKSGAAGFCSKTAWLNRCYMFLWRCAYCGRSLSYKTATQDHVIPLSRGGTGWPSNLVPACQTCNSKKHTNTWTPNAFYKIGRLP